MADTVGNLDFEYSLRENLIRRVSVISSDSEEVDLNEFTELALAHLEEVSTSDSLASLPPLSIFCNQVYHRLFGSSSQEDRFSGGNLVAIGALLGAFLNKKTEGFRDESRQITDDDITIISKTISDSLEIKRGQIAERYRAMEAEAFYPLYQMLEARQETSEGINEDLSTDEG